MNLGVGSCINSDGDGEEGGNCKLAKEGGASMVHIP